MIARARVAFARWHTRPAEPPGCTCAEMLAGVQATADAYRARAEHAEREAETLAGLLDAAEHERDEAVAARKLAEDALAAGEHRTFTPLAPTDGWRRRALRAEAAHRALLERMPTIGAPR